MRARLLILVLALCPLALCPLARALPVPAAGGDALKAGVFDPERAAPDFTLRSSAGGAVRLGQFRGKVVALAFGYSHCTAVCPLTLALLAQARRQLGEAGRDLQVLYVTVDPERDDAARMREFVGGFDPAFVGATGTAAELAAVRAAYGVSATRIPMSGGYGYAHSSFVLLIDRAGQLRALMPFGHSAGDFSHDLRILLKQ